MHTSGEGQTNTPPLAVNNAYKNQVMVMHTVHIGVSCQARDLAIQPVCIPITDKVKPAFIIVHDHKHNGIMGQRQCCENPQRFASLK